MTRCRRCSGAKLQQEAVEEVAGDDEVQGADLRLRGWWGARE